MALHLPGHSEAIDAGLNNLSAAREPVVILTLNDPYDLAAEFFRWEMATAVAAVSLGIDPFDEPNVQESKDNTKRVLAGYEQRGKLPTESPVAAGHGVSVVGGEPASSPEEALFSHLAKARPGDYVAIMAYVNPTDEHEEALQEFRSAIRRYRHRVATTLGFGPRFLHSTGQLHKGGPNTGVYIQVATTESADAAIPGQPFGFAVLERAQAEGDLQSLRDHGRRVIRLHIEGDLSETLEGLAEVVRGAAVASAG